MLYSTFIMFFLMFFAFTMPRPAEARQTFYVDNACTHNGDGTSDTCASVSGGPGPWNSLKASQYCRGMNPGDVIEIRRGQGIYYESMKPRYQCSGTPSQQTIIQNYPGEHVVLDGTLDIRDSGWQHQGSGVYLCAEGQCGTAKKFPFTAWYDTGRGEKRLNLQQTNRACDQTLMPGEMRYTAENQVCVHLDDSSNPARAAFFRIPFIPDAISIIAYDTDYLTIRKHPQGGSLKMRRYRDYGISTKTVNVGITYDGLDIGWVMDRCINQSQGGHQPAAYRIVNNYIHHCGQEGIRWSQDTSPDGLVANNLIEHIQVEPLFERCHPNCLPGFTDNGTAIRAVTIKNGKIAQNIIRNVGGGNKGRAYGINLENGAESIEVTGNFVYNMDLGNPWPNTGHAYLLSDSFADRFHQVTVANNVAHNVDICYALDFIRDTFQPNDIVAFHANVCSEPLDRGFELQDGIYRGTVSVKDNIFVSLQHSTSSLLRMHNFEDRSANVPTGNLFYCPNCDVIATYHDSTYREADIDQLGHANRYQTMPSHFDQTTPSLTVNNTVYTGGSDVVADDPPDDAPPETEPSNLIVLEVEDYDELEGTFEHWPSAAASAGAYMVVPQSVGSDYDGDGSPLAKLHYDLNMASGTYFLWVRTYGLDGRSDSFHVFVDQVKQKTLHTERGAWTWKRLPGDLTFDGTHRLTLALRESGTQADKMVITDDPDFVPTGFGPEAELPEDGQEPDEATHLFVSEAEHYDDLEGAFTEGMSLDASQAFYMVVPSTVGSDVDGDGQPLAKLHYDLHMTEGDYTVWIRTFGQHTGADSLFVSFDAGDIKALHVGTNGFQWYKVRRLYPLNGYHTFTIALREANTFVDKVVITDDPDFLPTGFGPEPR